VDTQRTKELRTLLLVNYCKRQPIGRLVSYNYVGRIIGFHPLKTRQGQSIMRQAITNLVADGYVFLVKNGHGIYLAFYRQ
jgi:hypothetical protein